MKKDKTKEGVETKDVTIGEVRVFQKKEKKVKK